MADPTPLDRAYSAAEAAPQDSALRMRFYDRLVSAELFLMLKEEPDGDDVQPEIFETGGTNYVLVFDTEARLAGATAGPVPFVAVSGRTLVAMLEAQSVGIGLNLGAGPSETLLGADIVDWLARMLSDQPEPLDAIPSELRTPAGLPEALVTALDAKLASTAGLAQVAYLAGVTYADGRRGHLLAFIGAPPGAASALARAAGEALTFSGIEAGEIDVVVLAADDPVAKRLERVGLRFDLPPPPDPALAPAPPGLDPSRPPKLR